MLESYKKHVEERAKQNIPPLPLDADQTSQLVELLKSEHKESELLLYLFKEYNITPQLILGSGHSLYECPFLPQLPHIILFFLNFI